MGHALIRFGGLLVVFVLGTCWKLIIGMSLKFLAMNGAGRLGNLDFTTKSIPASRIGNVPRIASVSVPIAASFPHVLHYTWSNKNFSFAEGVDFNNTVQRSILDNVGRIRQSNEGWDVKVWTDKECLDLLKTYFSEFYEEIGKDLNPRKLWDVARIAILYVHGGIYLDHDVVCDEGLQFTDWIGTGTKLLLLEPEAKKDTTGRKQNAVGNFFLGSVAGHPFWLFYLRNVIRDLPKNLWVLEHTGPRQLGSTIQEFMRVHNISHYKPSASDEIRILEPDEVAASNRQCMKGERERGLNCSQPRCIHVRGISPAELVENRTSQSWRFFSKGGQGDSPKELLAPESMKRVKSGKGTERRSKGGRPEGCARLTREECKKQVRLTRQEWRKKVALELPPGEYTKPICNPCTRPITVMTSEVKKKVIFIHIPKTGGTSVERHLNLAKPCHVTAAAIVNNCNREMFAEAFSFSVIRNPIQRALSMYYYARQGGNGSEKDQRKYNWTQELNFSSFVEALPKQKEFMYASQTYFLTAASSQNQVSGSVPTLIVNRVLCLGSIGKDWREIVEDERYLNVFGDFWDEIVRASDKRDEVVVDAFTEKRLHDIYRDDFLLWQEHCGHVVKDDISSPSKPERSGEEGKSMIKEKYAGIVSQS